MTIEEQVAALVAGAGLSGSGPLPERLGRVVEAYRDGRITEAEFSRRFAGELAGSYLGAYTAGGRTITSADLAVVAALVARQRSFIAGYAADIAAGRGTMPDRQRVGLYDRSRRDAANAGRIARAAQDDERLLWVAEDDENTCDPCSRAGGRIYRATELTQLPSDICDGGWLCRCELIPA